jgi:hypothetical protein
MSPATVAAMFTGNAVTLNGVVKAADSTVILTPSSRATTSRPPS